MIAINLNRMKSFMDAKEKGKGLSQYLKTFAPRSVIITEGESEQDFYCLLEGKVGVWKGEEDKEEKKIKVGEIDKKGAYFGEMGYLLQENRTASIIAETHVKVLKFPGTMLPELIVKQPQLGLKLCMTLAKRLKGTTASQQSASEQRDELREDISKQFFDAAETFQKIFLMLSSVQIQLQNPLIKDILTYMSNLKIIKGAKEAEVTPEFLRDVPESLLNPIQKAFEFSEKSKQKQRALEKKQKEEEYLKKQKEEQKQAEKNQDFHI